MTSIALGNYEGKSLQRKSLAGPYLKERERCESVKKRILRHLPFLLLSLYLSGGTTRQVFIWRLIF